MSHMEANTKGARMKLKEECGVTMYSLANAEMLLNARGVPMEIRVEADTETGDYKTIADFRDGSSHVFTGFSVGYCGEGPRGLHKFLGMCGMHIPFEQISNPAKLGERVILTVTPSRNVVAPVWGSK
jgi:hypothetical protein